MNNKMIHNCEVCSQDYCAECTEGVKEWTRFCSPQCEREAEEEKKRADPKSGR